MSLTVRPSAGTARPRRSRRSTRDRASKSHPAHDSSSGAYRSRSRTSPAGRTPTASRARGPASRAGSRAALLALDLLERPAAGSEVLGSAEAHSLLLLLLSAGLVSEQILVAFFGLLRPASGLHTLTGAAEPLALTSVPAGGGSGSGSGSPLREGTGRPVPIPPSPPRVGTSRFPTGSHLGTAQVERGSAGSSRCQSLKPWAVPALTISPSASICSRRRIR